MAIQIIPKRVPNRKIRPHYLLKIDYMIGDADGETQKEMKVNLGNKKVENFIRIIRKLKCTENRWGITLDDEFLDDAIKEKQITRKEYDFIAKLMFDEGEFSEICSSIEYSFLVFQGITLTYIDENGNSFGTRLVKDKQ